MFLSLAISHILPRHTCPSDLISNLMLHFLASWPTYTQSSQAEVTLESPHEKKNRLPLWVAYFTAWQFPVAIFPFQIPWSHCCLQPAGTSVCTRNTHSLPAHLLAPVTCAAATPDVHISVWHLESFEYKFRSLILFLKLSPIDSSIKKSTIFSKSDRFKRERTGSNK